MNLPDECIKCHELKTGTMIDQEGFDLEPRLRGHKTIIDTYYCENLLGECDPTRCEYRYIDTQAYQLQSIKQLITRHIINHRTDLVFEDIQNVNLETAIKFIDEMLQ